MRRILNDNMPNRYICTVLEEMRTCIETLNFSYLKSLVEEAQTLANRMEAALNDANDLEWKQEQLREVKKETKEYRKQKAELLNEIEKLEEKKERLSKTKRKKTIKEG